MNWRSQEPVPLELEILVEEEDILLHECSYPKLCRFEMDSYRRVKKWCVTGIVAINTSENLSKDQ